MQHKYSFILSGGGTGGHIFPAVSIANELKEQFPDANIHFVGAKDRMEMQKIPQAGYTITGIWISGIQRTQLWKNFSFPFKLISSIWDCRKVISKHKPNAVIGTGGFASGPLMYVAQKRGIPTFIQEQNSYPGITNKLLAKKAKKICVAYDNLERFFPAESIVKTGNPIRNDILNTFSNHENTQDKTDQKRLLIIGGSLGARSINNQLANCYQQLLDSGIHITWQCGKLYYDEMKAKIKPHENLILTEFLTDMSEAYSNADLIISRAGAGAISELCIVGKPVILIPSPNVAEDHQSKNAKAICDEGAAIFLKESDITEMQNEVLKLFKDSAKKEELSRNIKGLAKPNATKDIVNEIMQFLS